MLVFGEGAQPARVLAIGEAPGREEDLTGRPFVGRSGQLLDRYFGRGGVPPRDALFLTNVIKQRPPQNRDPLPEEVAYWLPSLCAEISSTQPTTILTLGRFALRLFLDLDMESAHGMTHEIPLDRIREPLRSAFASYHLDPVIVFASYHPAFALHDPTMLSLLTYDMERFGQYCLGQLPARHVDDDSRGHYELITKPSRMYSHRIGLDTEGYKGLPSGQWLSYSDRPDRGFAMRAKDAPAFRRWLEGNDAHDAQVSIVLHHALHDLPILREMGIDLVEMGIPFTDTMCAAYALGLEPQGLKPLGFRHCGMRMSDYSDLTAVSDDRIAREWLIQLCATLPEAQPAKSTRKKSDPVIEAYDSLTADLARARVLIERMLTKPLEIRKRWNQKKCAARVILEEELALIDDMPLPSLDDVIEDHGGDPTTVINYVGADPDATRRLEPLLGAQIDAYGLRDVLDTTVGIIPMIDRMQSVGIKVNPDHFAALIPILDGQAADLDERIATLAGYPLNASSGDQVADLLFTRLAVHRRAPNLRLKKTDSGRYSTDDKALEALDGTHAVVALIRARREITKLKGAYVLPIGRLTDDDGRLRCELLLTRTDTGRLAAKRPNLLAWPKHSELGMLIRHGFVADLGHEFGAWDMDQIEMRVFADNANEVNMLLAFAAGKDLHTDTAALIFGRPYDVIFAEYKLKTGKGGEQRFAAKAVNFGILMGITEYGLVAQFHKNKQLHWTLDDCRKLLADWKRAYPSGAAWITSKHEEARRYSYVRDMFGRLRWLDGVHSEDEYVRAEAQRMAQSTPIQSGAQGIMQRAMRNLWSDLVALRRSTWTEPLLQTHDELLFEYDTRVRADMDRLVMGHMGSAVSLKVPVTAKAAYGLTWGEVSA